ncbi:MAG: phage tail tape measure protein [Salaquimonas sp.]
MDKSPQTTVSVNADLSSFNAAMNAAKDSTKDFGRIFTSTLKSAAITGKSFEETLRSIAMRLSTMALNKAFAPIENTISSLMNNVLASFAAPVPNAKGGAYSNAGPIPFAKGGVVSSPSLFSFAGGTGLMGEAGAEAVMPLTRGADGKLGVAAKASAAPVNVVFNVQSSDAASFKRSEGQLTAMLARTVQRGQRKL